MKSWPFILGLVFWGAFKRQIAANKKGELRIEDGQGKKKVAAEGKTEEPGDGLSRWRRQATGKGKNNTKGGNN